MSPKKALILAALLAVLLYSGPALAAEAAAPAAGPVAKPEKVSMKNTAFNPNVVMVQVNLTVTWTNNDGFNHDVTAIDGSFNSTGGTGGIAPGQTWVHNFTTPGVYDYYCVQHSPKGPRDTMWGRVIVVEAPFLAMAGTAGGPNPEEIGVNWLAHWVGLVSFVAVAVTLLIYYFVLKYGESIHTTDHRDRKEK